MTANPTALPSLLDDEVAEELRATVRALLKARGPSSHVLLHDEPAKWGVGELTAALADELGVTGLLVPEELGGAGAGAREAAVVAEELGRVLAPVPFLETAVLAPTVLLGCADTAATAAELRQLAAGEAVGTLAVPATTWPGGPFPSDVTVTGQGLRGSLRGTVPAVLSGDRADLLVVPCRDEAAACLALVDVRAAGDAVRRTPLTSLDITRPVAEVTLSGCPARIVATGATAEAALERALLVGAAVLAAEQLGVAERCLEMAVEYLKLRYQFGRPIGSFQAPRHRAADLWARLRAARSSARYAAACAAGERDDLPVAAALAAACCGELALRAAEDCVQLHGGIGFTWEHPAHLYLKRAASQLSVLGDPDRHRARLAELVDLPSGQR